MANRTIEIRITAANKASSVIDRVVQSLGGLGHAADGASGRVGTLGRIMETGLGVAVGNLVANAFHTITGAIQGFAAQAIAAVGKAQALEMSLTGLLTEANMYQAVTEQRRVAITTVAAEREELIKLTLQRDTATAKIQEQMERVRQLTAQWGEEGLAVKTSQAKLAEMVFARDQMTASLGKLGDAETRYTTITESSVKQVMSFEDAQAQAEEQVKGLLAAIQRLAIVSPFETAQVEQIASMGLMANMSTKEVEKFTAAWLDYAAVHGITSSNLAFAADQFLQLAKIGKITTIDLRQLRRLGIDVSKILGVDLGMSAAELTERFGDLSDASKGVFSGMGVEEFNKAVEKSPEMMDALFDKFTVYAEKTSQGAAQKMAETISGMMGTARDIVDLGSRSLFRPIVEAVSPAIAGVLGKIADMVTGGKLEAIGKEMGERMTAYMADFKDTTLGRFVGRIADAFKVLRKQLGAGTGPAEALARAMAAIVPKALWKGLIALGQGLDKVASAAARMVKGALGVLGEWFATHGPEIQAIAARIAAALGELFGNLAGEGAAAEQGLRGVIGTILDVGLRAFEGLATAIEFAVEHWEQFRIVLGLVGAYLAGRQIVGGILTIMRHLNPLSLLIGAVSLAVGIFKKAWDDNWNGIRDKLTDAWSKIKPVIESLGGFISGLVAVLTDTDTGKLKLTDAIAGLGDALVKLGIPQDVVDRILLVGKGIGDIAAALASLMAGDVTGTIDNVAGAIANFAGAILNWPQDKVDKVTEFLADLGETAYQTALEWWKDEGPKVKKKIEEFGEAVLNGAACFADFAQSLLVTTWQKTLDWFKTDGKDVGASIQGLADSVGNLVAAFGAGVTTGVSGEEIDVLGNFVGLMNRIQDINLENFTASVQVLVAPVEALIRVLAPVAEGIGTLTGKVDALGDRADVVEEIAGWLWKLFTPMGLLASSAADLKTSLLDLKTAVDDAGGIRDYLQGLSDDVVALGGNMILHAPGISGFVVLLQTLPESMQQAVVERGVSFALVGQTIVQMVIQGFVNAWTGFTGHGIPGMMATLVAAVIGAVGVDVKDLQKQGETIAGAIEKGVKIGWEVLKAYVLGKVIALPVDIAKGVIRITNDLKAAGKDIVEAIKAGIENAWGAFVNWVVGKMVGLAAAILGALNIESPPDWAVDAGASIVDGIQAGMESRLGALGATVAAMADIVSGAEMKAPNLAAALPTLSPPTLRPATVPASVGAGGPGASGGGSSSTSYGGDTYNVTINDAVAAAMFMNQARARSADRLNQGMGR